MAEQQTLPPQTQKQQPGRETEMHPKPDYMPRYPGSGRLEDKVALITGGDSGIGRAVAVLFAREGANVAIMYLNEGEDARETMRIVEAEGRECLAIAGDVGDAGFCEKAIEQVIDRFGRLDVLVNNAAEQHPQKEIDNITPEQIERTFRTNIFGYFFLTQAALPHLKEGASIINTTSVTAYRGSPELLDYSSTKGAIVAFTRSLAKKLVEKGIRVNGVAPGPIWTPLIPSTFDAKHVASFGAQTPMKRPGQPNEVAPSFLFLACEDSSYITGSVLHPNGGEPTES
ncbi:MAG: family oxidoreductase [Microvirga sp.]|jgi:NAD(P)-dependent dehydrogenase (short-subunit alcohol dehydrogenase family)|nr:family oxidoreductase [Microvirga sp.]